MLNKTGYNFGLRTNYTVKKKEVENKEQKNEVQKQVDNKTNTKQTTQAKPLANANEILAQQNLSMISINNPKQNEKVIVTAGVIKMPEEQEEPKGPITTAGTIKMPEEQEEPKGPIITAGTIKMPESNNQNKETFIGPKVEGNTTDNINNSVPEPTPMNPGNQMKTGMTFEKHMTNVLKERLDASNYDLSKVDFEDMVNYIKENAADNQISNLSELINEYVSENMIPVKVIQPTILYQTTPTENLKDKFNGALEIKYDKKTDIPDEIKDKLNSAFDKMKDDEKTNIADEVKDKLNSAFDKMKDDEKTNIADEVKDKFNEAFDKMKKDDNTNTTDEVKDKFNEAFDKMKKDNNTNTKNTAKDTINKGIEYNGLINNNKDINGIYNQTPINTLGNFRTRLDRNKFLR